MPTMSVSLSDTEQELIDAESRRRGLAGDEFVRFLVHRELSRSENARMDQLLMEGLATEAREMTPDDWNDIHRAVLDGS